MTILKTPRLRLREFCPDDAPFALQLVNEPAWLRFIGDRDIRDLEAACGYIRDVLAAMYREQGFGLWLVERREDGTPLGMCGLIKRAALPGVDLGFAFLAAYHRQGYALEAARATMDHAKVALGLTRLLAVTLPDNNPSLRLLAKLGFVVESEIRLVQGAPAAKLCAVLL